MVILLGKYPHTARHRYPRPSGYSPPAGRHTPGRRWSFHRTWSLHRTRCPPAAAAEPAQGRPAGTAAWSIAP
ncbi:MAG TPA: hypothetical protein VHO84_09120, partial [Syntrophorhabdaceae bacterium]|nr:hypothetical protein [Syntrophorhabdaceae bacterium]